MDKKEKKQLVILAVLVGVLAASWLYTHMRGETPVAREGQNIQDFLGSAGIMEASVPAPKQAADKLPDVQYTGRKNRDPLESSIIEETAQEDAGQSAQEAPVFPKDRFTVSAVVWGSDNPQAIINDEVMSVGDALEGAKIVSIDKEGVHLEFDGKEILLEVI